MQAVQTACFAPFDRIATNATGDGEQVAALRSRVLEALRYNTSAGIDFRKRQKTQLSEEFEVKDLVTSGVIDPLLVVKNSLLYGSSIASILLTADCAVLQLPGERYIEHEEFKL